MVFPVVIYGCESWTIKMVESESHLVVSDSLRPHGLYSPWNSPGQNTGVSSRSLLQELSQPRDWTQVSHITGGFFTSWATREAQEYWGGEPVPSPEDLPDPGIKPGSPALQAYSLPAELLGKPTKDGWALKNWCFQTVELVKTLESPLDSKEIKLVNPKGNQPWIFIGRTDIEDDAPILRPPVAKSWLIGKDPDAGKDWGQEQKGAIEGAMVGWHHRLNGHEFEQALGYSEGWESLMCSNPRCHRESAMTEQQQLLSWLLFRTNGLEPWWNGSVSVTTC